ncbi:MAG: putative Mg2+ transporter-C (MgtC) family [Erysipelotrichaceae bacterium]|nr:MAG: putative Mg2+ transporter-C (MgtC) family [Erysipelotrichaceae bacterium]
MMTSMFEFELIFRIALASFCGALIGFERMNRLKEAGIKTHTVVALGSALIMVVSKYGFMDIYDSFGTLNDPSRIAAQIVTGVGFLGAGMILIKKQTVSGLTTAAIIWTTSGIGMTIGSGLYMIGVSSTILLLCFQLFFHSKFMRRIERSGETILVETSQDSIEEVLAVFHNHKININSFKVSKFENNTAEIEIIIIRAQHVPQLINDLSKIPTVKHVEY